MSIDKEQLIRLIKYIGRRRCGYNNIKKFGWARYEGWGWWFAKVNSIHPLRNVCNNISFIFLKATV